MVSNGWRYLTLFSVSETVAYFCMSYRCKSLVEGFLLGLHEHSFAVIPHSGSQNKPQSQPPSTQLKNQFIHAVNASRKVGNSSDVLIVNLWWDEVSACSHCFNFINVCLEQNIIAYCQWHRRKFIMALVMVSQLKANSKTPWTPFNQNSTKFIKIDYWNL